jgi:thiamin-phosphate kinase
LGVPTDRLILGPAVGEDAAIIDMGDQVIVLATDPITGATRNIGWLSVHINANDVASCGARPLWYLSSILLPEKADEEMLEQIMTQVDHAAHELNVSVIGGHSEVSPRLSNPIIVGFMIGETRKNQYVTSRGAKLGDKIILTKGVGIEGTAILATELVQILKQKIDKKTLDRSQSFIKDISIVKEAMIAVGVGGVHAMHDPTEGGIITGLWELAEASHKGIVVFEEKIPVASETKKICKLFKIDPLKIMSSGALLISIRSNKANELLSTLQREGVIASIIGEVTRFKNGRILKKNGSSIKIVPPEQDHVYKVLNEFHIS